MLDEKQYDELEPLNEEEIEHQDQDEKKKIKTLTPEDHKKNFWQRKTLSEKIIFIVVIILIVLFIILALAGPYIFAPGSALYEISVENIGKFFDFGHFFTTKYPIMIETVAIIIFLWVLYKVIQLIIWLITVRGHRSSTVGRLIISVLKYGIAIVGLFLILSAWGVETPTLLASAGIIGLAISFGAQSLIADVLSGLFIIFEKQFQIGDIIQIDDFRGEVLEIGVRVTKFVDIAGDIKTINNSEIRSAINTTSNYSPVICDVLISYSANLEEVEKVIIDNLPTIKEAVPQIKEGPSYRGVSEFGQNGVMLRIYAKTLELDKYQAKRDINRQLRLILAKNNIEIPYQQVVVHNVSNNDKKD